MARTPGRTPPLFVVERLDDRITPAVGYALSKNTLIAFDMANPSGAAAGVAITGLAANDTLVGLDVRPETGGLYALSVGNGGVRLYSIDPRTAKAAGIGAVTSATGAAFGFDFDPTGDAARVVSNTGANLRINPNTGGLIDGNSGAPVPIGGVNPDGPIDGATTTVDAAAYTNSVRGATFTTLYTLDATTDTMYRQVSPVSGTQTAGLPVTLNGVKLDFTNANGFDIPAGVGAAAAGNDVAVAGNGYALLTVGGVSSLYSIDLATGAATLVGKMRDGTPTVQGFAVMNDAGGLPAVGLSADGTALVRFATNDPGTSTRVTITGVTAGETLVGIAARATTRQIFALGVNPTADTATLYTLNPTTGAAAVVNSAVGAIQFVGANGAKIDLPDPGAGYGFDFNPAADRIRVVTGTGLNFRINPGLGLPVDGDLGQTDPVAGTNPDGPINGGPAGVTGTAYTNSGAAATVTTQYTLDPVGNTLNIQSPPNAGTQTGSLSVTLNGAPLDFDAVVAFDIPASVAVANSNDRAAGAGYAVLTVGGTARLYRINLTTGAATALGAAPEGAQLRGLVVGDGPAGAVSFAPNQFTANEADGVAKITLLRAGGSAGRLVVTVVPVSGTLLQNNAIGGLPAQVVFEDGQTTATVDVAITNDAVPNGTRSAVLGLSGGITGAVPTATLTVTDDDGDPKPVPAKPQLLGVSTFAVGTNPGGNTAKLYNADQTARESVPAFDGFDGVRVAVADVNGDGTPDLIVGNGPNGPTRLRVLDGVNQKVLFETTPFEESFEGGVWVAAGDIDGDGKAEIVVTPDRGGGPRVRVYRGSDFQLIADFFGIDDPNFRGGARAAVGDVNGDARSDIVVSAGFLGGPRIAGFSGASLVGTPVGSAPARLFADFFAFEDTLRNGAFVALGDVNGDRQADLILGGGPDGGPRVRILDAAAVIAAGAFGTADSLPASAQFANFFAGDPENRGGIRVVAKDLDGDSQADLVVGAGDGGGSKVTGYLGKNLFAGVTTSHFSFDAFPGFPHGVYVG